MQEGPAPDVHRVQTMQRIAGFSDGTAAIALTLLVLPLVDVARGAPPDQPVLRLLADNRGDLLAFAVSFLVIAQFWSARRRTGEGLVDYDGTLLALNTFWLLAVVFLPFPTARLFVQSRLTTGSAVLYLGTMLVISLLSVAEALWIIRHPRLTGDADHTSPAALQVRRDGLARGASVVATFAAATLVAVVLPGVALYLLLALPVVQRLVVVSAHRRRPHADRPGRRRGEGAGRAGTG